MRRILRTGKSKSKDEIQGSFTAFRMTTKKEDDDKGDGKMMTKDKRSG
jgi:hypothetical protein